MTIVRLVLGWVMIAFSALVLGHLVWAGGKPITPSLWLDVAFIALFLLRGVMNLRGVRRARSGT